MTPIHKVPASAGAHWLLSGLTLLRRAPFALASVALSGLMVLMLSVFVSALVLMLGQQVPLLGPLADLFGSVLPAAVNCFVFAGVLYAAREVAQGRPAMPAHLFHGFEHPRSLLLVALLPAAGNMLSSLLLVALTQDDAAKFAEILGRIQAMSQAGQQPDPVQLQAALLQLPMLGVTTWVLLAVGITLVTWGMMMLAVPLVVFGGQHGLTALRVALAAAARNLGAILVYLLLLTAFLFALGMAGLMLALVASVLLGPTLALAMAALLQFAVVLPLRAGGAYHAYHQIFEGMDPLPQPSAGPPDVIAA